MLTHSFADECRPALGEHVRLIETGWRIQLAGSHYIDAAIEYLAGPALVLRLPIRHLCGVVFFGGPSVPAMWFARRLVLPVTRRSVPVLYFCFEPPRVLYSDTADIVARLGAVGRLLAPPLFHIYRALDRRMVRSAHRILANSPFGARRIWSAYKRRAVVIEHGVDFTLPDPQQVQLLRERYGLGARPVALTVNHLHPRKRVDLFLRAVHIAARSVPGLTAVVVGAGPEHGRLEALARELGVVGRDVIFTGAVPEEELPAHYALGDVYVHTAREESFGLSVIEALRLGLPVVSVDEGGPRDTVQNGVSGYLVPAHPQALGEAIVRLLADPQRARSMGRAGAEFVARRFNWERGAATLLSVLGEVDRRSR